MHVAFRDILFEPKPVQRPGPPIWVGGEGTAAQKRAGELGDGWYPTIRNPKEPLDDPKRLAASLAGVHRFAAAVGRDPAGIDVAIFAPGYALGAPAKSRDGGRMTFTGSAEEIAADARAYREAGVRHINIGFESTDLDDVLRKLDAFVKQVVPRVG